MSHTRQNFLLSVMGLRLCFNDSRIDRLSKYRKVINKDRYIGQHFETILEFYP